MRIGSKTVPDLVLSSYPDREDGRLALRNIRRAGFRRAAAISRLPGGGIVVDDFGVRDSILDLYQRWVTAGETLVIVEVEITQARTLVALLNDGADTQQAMFLLRPHRDVSWRAAELQRQERVSREQLSLYATRLADRHGGAIRARRPQPLWDRLRDCERTVDAITEDLSQAVHLEQTISVSARWLLDNAYVIKRQLAEARRNLSHQLYDVLPTLEVGPHQGEPRAYDLSAELVAHTDADLAEQDVVDFLLAYQHVLALTMSELWALPLLLRLALAERLSYLAARIDDQHHELEWADFWANRLLVAARHSRGHLLFILAELACEQPNPSAMFADRLIGRLRGESHVLEPVLAWLELKWGQPVFEAIQQEGQRHVADQATITNGITSLRLLARLDWRGVFEQVSLVEAALRAEPADVYRRMDFGTRDRYRHVVEEIARRSHATELQVARAAVEAASAAGDGFQGHVGYHLIDAGRQPLESRVGYHPTVGQQFHRSVFRRPILLYLGGVTLGTAAILAFILSFAVPPHATLARFVLLVVLCLVALVPASELAVQIVNFTVATALHPDRLPKLAFSDGVPDEWRTLTVVPTLFASPESIREDLEHLEIRYLANHDANLRFALLADLVDAPKQEMSEDAGLIETAVHGIDLLNHHYPERPFALFCRPRRWSETERCWMGWERKRGKLEELNAWLLDKEGTSPETLRPIAGDPSQLHGVRLVITLDADTQLPHGAARRLIGALAHPLNRPRLAPDGRQVIGGYTIIQPRVSPSLPTATATRYARMFADSSGVDPYTQAVSDLYQDLAGEGSYYGKGIYDVETFHQVLGGRFPSATLLSHDLLEGAYVRVGMATDVELYDAFPGSFVADVGRQHRWTRGDWQIAAWLGATVPVAGGLRESNPIGTLNRWKILDNLRRSLVPATSVGLLLAGWLLFPDSAALWSLLIGLTMLLPPALRLIAWVPGQPSDVLASVRTWHDQGIIWLHALIGVALLPYQSVLALDAVARTLWRSLVTHHHLLEWQTAKAASKNTRSRDRRLAMQLAVVGIGSLGVGATLILANPTAAPPAAPYLLLWLLSPVIVGWLGAAQATQPEGAFNDSDRHLLRRIARETWRYFDDFVGPETNWLPPDNYQEAPRAELAERTSPTNIGLWLLATLAAHDLGYLTPHQVAERGEATLGTLERLERFEGHLLNWYNTRTLDPLLPRYVSTVDSGNLLASLWTLARGYREMLARPIIGPEALRGLADTLALIPIPESSASELPRSVDDGHVRNVARDLARLFANPPDHPSQIVERLRTAVGPARELGQALRAVSSTLPGHSTMSDEAGAAYWAAQVERQVLAWLDVVDRCRPSAEGTDGVRSDGQKAADPADSATPSSAEQLAARFQRLTARVESLADAMKMRFLYDPKRRLFTVGCNVDDRRSDSSYYDLLASEARLASLVAIAQGDVPAEHWFALGRPFGKSQGHRVLFSWSGTMFEYLMPLLLTRGYRHTLLDEAVREAVGFQIAYGSQQCVPWGISESAFAALDTNLIYQYQAFGVPGLGLKRGLADDLVVAPYASALALMVDPEAALKNLKRLAQSGLRGGYGYYESVDFTQRRQLKGRHGIVVHTYMVHHQGMTLLALDNVLNDGVMPGRFHADRRVQAVEPLLYERAPVAPLLVEAIERGEARPRLTVASPADPTVPSTPLLGNGASNRVDDGDRERPQLLA